MDIVIENPERADQILKEIDAIIAWKSDLQNKVEQRMMTLANHLLEAYQNAYWIRRGYQDETQYIEATFKNSRSLYYDLIRIAKNLNHYDHKLLEQIGFAKCRELCKVQKSFGTVPNNYFLHAQEEDSVVFKERVKAVVHNQEVSNPAPKEEVSFVTLSFSGSQIYDFNEALKIAMMEGETDKTTEAVCIMARDFLSGYRDDGKGRIYDRNTFIMSIIGRLLDQMDRKKPEVYDRLITQLATWVEKGREGARAELQEEESETEPGGVR
jgi:hypothetical protein